jgi:two-component system OmpR family sensor kinase
MAVIAVLISYLSARHEAKEIQDESLEQVALLIKNDQIKFPPNRSIVTGSRIIIQSFQDPYQKDSSDLTGSLKLPNNLSDGFRTITIDGINYRVLKITLANHKSFVIANPSDLSDEAALSGAISTALPMFLLSPILITAAYLLIRNAFQPIIDLSEDVHKRSAQDLTPFPAEIIPLEVRPLIAAINLLFDKVNQSIDSQSRFIADAAHELRSPLTALSLQSERLASAKMSAPASEHLIKLRLGIARTSALLEQLLSFAKAQRLPNRQDTNLSVNQTILNVLEDLMPIAEIKNLNIGIKSKLDVRLNMNEADLICIVRNILDNAIRYTPNGGQIYLSVHNDFSHVVLEIEDSGDGIPDNEKERVFDAFYRILGNESQGSGLGLSIVKTILNRLAGNITLINSDNFKSGLKVSVYLPLNLVK